ncbi:hypothetical protein NCCP2495_11430 [Dietzia sp. NCCP-2495]|nr:hypothetical protein NCCP2495_11430 [Dietzia sp. NCCP-2495]
MDDSNHTGRDREGEHHEDRQIADQLLEREIEAEVHGRQCYRAPTSAATAGGLVDTLRLRIPGPNNVIQGALD